MRFLKKKAKQNIDKKPYLYTILLNDLDNIEVNMTGIFDISKVKVERVKINSMEKKKDHYIINEEIVLSFKSSKQTIYIWENGYSAFEFSEIEKFLQRLGSNIAMILKVNVEKDSVEGIEKNNNLNTFLVLEDLKNNIDSIDIETFSVDRSVEAELQLKSVLQTKYGLVPLRDLLLPDYRDSIYINQANQIIAQSQK